MEKDIKIFVSCHKPSKLPACELFVPIQVGSALAKTRMDMLQDDEGDNISDKNRMYCELTAQYWIWKHVEADYYGFCHYRRFFSFSDEKLKENIYGAERYDALTPALEERFGMDEESIRRKVGEADIIVATSANLKLMGFRDLYDQYAKAAELNGVDMKCAVRVLKEKYPEYADAADHYMSGRVFYPCNMFIMNKALFQEYSEWLFTILEETERRIDISDYSIEGRRTIGHISERLLGIFVEYQKKQGARTKVLQWGIMDHTDPFIYPKPAFEKNNVPIVLCCNDYYVPFTSVTLLSLLENTTPAHNYDILFLHTNIMPKNQERLLKLTKGYENVSLRFVNIIELVSQVNWIANNHITVESFYRLDIAKVLAHYDKALYLDCDMLICRDVAELYATDVSDVLLAATVDADHAGQYGGARADVKEYTEKVLKLAHPLSYFQAGVILFNLAAFRKTFAENELVEFAQKREYMYMDQDILNAKCAGRVKTIPMNWNVMTDCDNFRMNQVIRKAAPQEMYETYMEARKDPWIIHYAGGEKPWNNPLSDYAEEFWEVARRSPLYEAILRRMSENAASWYAPAPKVSFVRRLGDRLMPIGTRRRGFFRRIYRFFVPVKW